MQPTILVVDDSSLIRRQLRAALEGAGFAVVEAKDGREALSVIDERPVALTICDVNMPDLDGLTFLESLRSRNEPNPLPFIFLTAEADPAMISRARNLGASGWVVKPFDPKKLVEATRRLTDVAA